LYKSRIDAKEVSEQGKKFFNIEHTKDEKVFQVILQFENEF
jgi:hypothetical protein